MTYKNKYKFKFADNGVIIEQPSCSALDVIEYGEKENRSTPVEHFLGSELWGDIEAAGEFQQEAVQEWEIEVTIKPKG